MNKEMRKTLKVLYPDQFGNASKQKRKRKNGFIRKQINSFKAFVNEIGRTRLLTSALTLSSIILLAYCAYVYNQFTTLESNISNASANIEKEIQRRNDLINNLIPPTLQYLDYEKKIFSQMAQLRKETLEQHTVVPETKGALSQLTNSMSQQMPSLIGVFENYPDLKASKPFTDLMQELVQTENRIAEKRELYNEAVRKYNTYITRVPARWVALTLQYEEMEWFKVSNDALQVPDMKQLQAFGLALKP